MAALDLAKDLCSSVIILMLSQCSFWPESVLTVSLCWELVVSLRLSTEESEDEEEEEEEMEEGEEEEEEEE